MYPLRFTDVDLTANRRGDLTDAQHKRLDAELERARSMTGCMALTWATMFAFLMGMTLLAAYDLAGRSLTRLFDPSNREPIVVLGVFFLLACVGLFSLHILSLRGLANRTIKVAEGETHIIRRTMSRGTSLYPIYRVRLKNGTRSKTFAFPDLESLAHFEDGQPVRVYYSGGYDPFVLSCEPLLPDKYKRDAS